MRISVFFQAKEWMIIYRIGRGLTGHKMKLDVNVRKWRRILCSINWRNVADNSKIWCCLTTFSQFYYHLARFLAFSDPYRFAALRDLWTPVLLFRWLYKSPSCFCPTCEAKICRTESKTLTQHNKLCLCSVMLWNLI